MGIAWVAGGTVLKSAKKKQTKAEIASIEMAVEAYHARYGQAPDDILPATLRDGVDAFIPARAGILERGDRYLDPYEIEYKFDPITGVISSAGLDGDHGTADDVRN